jgi:hypothetical protein
LDWRSVLFHLGLPGEEVKELCTFSLQADIFNTLNARTVVAQATTYGATLNTPTSVLLPRIVAFGGQFHF